jgi:hypothetical protein
MGMTFLCVSAKLFGDDVALVNNGHRHGLAVLHRRSLPDALVVELEVGNAGEAGCFDALPRLFFGEGLRPRQGLQRSVFPGSLRPACRRPSQEQWWTGHRQTLPWRTQAPPRKSSFSWVFLFADLVARSGSENARAPSAFSARR